MLEAAGLAAHLQLIMITWWVGYGRVGSFPPDRAASDRRRDTGVSGGSSSANFAVQMDSSLPASDDARSYLDDQEPNYQLYVANLPNHVEEHIKRLFRKYNAVSLRLKYKGYRCFAFVGFEDYSSMQFAFRQLNSSSFEGRFLRVREYDKCSSSNASSIQDSKDERNKEDFSAPVETVTETDINTLKYSNLKLKRTKLELEVLKLRLEIQKLQKGSKSYTDNCCHDPL
ncbi:uncharacterized protein LOC135056675 isoform X2 [Pseudophryne corroboree]|uniref:uncharacterized protein LOC135056675 isoform X2 n=1 Tax=Pseudophryne corroboree TaxID=495146 RepID=UPI003081F19B